jgi:hypothetical protein
MAYEKHTDFLTLGEYMYRSRTATNQQLPGRIRQRGGTGADVSDWLSDYSLDCECEG